MPKRRTTALVTTLRVANCRGCPCVQAPLPGTGDAYFCGLDVKTRDVGRLLVGEPGPSPSWCPLKRGPVSLTWEASDAR